MRDAGAEWAAIGRAENSPREADMLEPCVAVGSRGLNGIPSDLPAIRVMHLS